jgi:hypothetical protein
VDADTLLVASRDMDANNYLVAPNNFHRLGYNSHQYINVNLLASTLLRTLILVFCTTICVDPIVDTNAQLLGLTFIVDANYLSISVHFWVDANKSPLMSSFLVVSLLTRVPLT